MMTTGMIEAFDGWIRGNFRDMNTELEELYFAQEQRHVVDGIGDALKLALVNEGRDLIFELLKCSDIGTDSEQAYNVLGCVGLYMAACRRHEITEPSREKTSPLVDASTLALFFDYNTLSMFAYMRAAEALRRIVHLGISHPLTYHLFRDTHVALQDVGKWSELLYRKLDVERFFFCVRPYLKPYRVGPAVYRGANAGDFAGVNVVDLLLGLCNANDLTYSQLLTDKFLFMLPEEQTLLKDCMRRRDFMTLFVEEMDVHRQEPWFKKNLEAFLAVVDQHGKNAVQHHHQLVQKFIVAPAAWLPDEGLTNITASGPPLPVLLKSLEKLRDLRQAADRPDSPSRHSDLQRLRSCL
jgi:hypothetical protein